MAVQRHVAALRLWRSITEHKELSGMLCLYLTRSLTEGL